MTELATINVLRSSTGTVFPPTQRSAKLIRHAPMNTTRSMTTVQPSRTPDSTNSRLIFTVSPNAQQTVGNHGNRRGSGRSQQLDNVGNQISNSGTGNGMDSGQPGSRNGQQGQRGRNTTGKSASKSLQTPSIPAHCRPNASHQHGRHRCVDCCHNQVPSGPTMKGNERGDISGPCGVGHREAQGPERHPAG